MIELRILTDACFSAQVDQAVQRFHASYPEMKAVVSIAGAPDCLQRLKAGEVYDLVILADSGVASAMMPQHIDGYHIFAGNRVVVSYTPEKRINAHNWREKLSDPKATIGHPEPTTHAAGYAALMACMLADSVAPGFAKTLLNHPGRKVLTTESETVDYAFAYRTDCIAKKMSYASLPDTMDLSEPAFNAHYAAAKFDVSGDGENIVRASAISHALAIPVGAHEPEAAKNFIEVLMQHDFKAQGFLPRSQTVGKSPLKVYGPVVAKAAPVQYANY